MGDTIDQRGWDLRGYKRNPVVLLAHNHASEPIAKCSDIRVDARGLVGTLEPPPRGLSPLADRVFDLWDGGFLNATSVGFRPLTFALNEQRGGVDFLTQELLEISIVAVPANAAALAEGRAGVDAVRRWGGGAVAPVATWARDLVLEIADARPGPPPRRYAGR